MSLYRRKSALLGMMILGISAALVLSRTGQPSIVPKATPEAELRYTQTQPEEEVPLRLSEPVEEIVADLEAYIPRRMDEAGVPGLALTLIRDKHLVWSAAFGLANAISGRAVTPETVFEAASISKVVTTYTALRLVERGKLALDVPLSVFLGN